MSVFVAQMKEIENRLKALNQLDKMLKPYPWFFRGEFRDFGDITKLCIRITLARSNDYYKVLPSEVMGYKTSILYI